MLGIVFGAFVVLLFLGLPIAGSMIFSTLLPSFMVENFPGNLNYMLRAVVSGLDTMSILAIPLFMLSGAIMAQGGISRKLFDIFAVFIGKFKAGMPCAVVVTCLFYGAISGSGPATAAAVGAMCIPILVELGYDKVISAAIVATAGGLGVIIPPSIPTTSWWASMTPCGTTGSITPSACSRPACPVRWWWRPGWDTASAWWTTP